MNYISLVSQSNLISFVKKLGGIHTYLTQENTCRPEKPLWFSQLLIQLFSIIILLPRKLEYFAIYVAMYS